MFDRYLTGEERGAFLSALINDAELIEITREVRACRDPKDDKFLELAACGSATHLISGDDDLLSLNPFEGIPILTAAAFIAQVSGDPTTPPAA
jgi:predicted nucleic acid-binding protein